MIFLSNPFMCDRAKAARHTSNLEPVNPGFRVNWILYSEILKARNLLGPAKMQDMRFCQLINHSAKTTTT